MREFSTVCRYKSLIHAAIVQYHFAKQLELDRLAWASRLLAGSKRIATVNGNCLAVKILVRSAEQDTLSHVAVVAWAASRNLTLELVFGDVTLLIRSRLAMSGHLGREHPCQSTLVSALCVERPG